MRTLGVEKHIQEIQGGSSRIPKPPISLLQLVIHVVKKKKRRARKDGTRQKPHII